MKKLTALLIALMLVLGLAACAAPAVTDAPTDAPAVTDAPTDAPAVTDAPTDAPAAPEATETADASAAEDDAAYIADKGTLVIGITLFDPMNYYDDSGKLVGFDTEFAEALCQKLGLTPEFVDLLDEGFAEFFENIAGSKLQAEFLLPTNIGHLLEQGRVSVKVLKTTDKWFGVTY